MTEPTERFAWHPEPELIGYGDAATSRAAMERLVPVGAQILIEPSAKAVAIGHLFVCQCDVHQSVPALACANICRFGRALPG